MTAATQPAAARARRGPLTALRHTLSDPMLRGGHALIASAGVTQLVGVLYWLVAAREYPAAAVGRNSAAIAITLFLAGVAELNLMSTLVRFLPGIGAGSGRFILRIYAASAIVAPVAGVIFLLLIPTVEPRLEFLRSSPVLAVWFVFSVVTGAIFVLQDSALTGVRAAPFVPVENAVFSVLKLLAMIAFVSLLPREGIYVSWTAAFTLAVVPTNIYLFTRAIPRHQRRTPRAAAPPKFADIRSFLVPDSAAAFFFMASTLLLPLYILARLGATAAGHYTIPWMIGYALYLVSLNMGASLVVETAADQSELRQRCARAITHLAKLLVPAVLLIVVFARFGLGFFGASYASADVTLMRLLALSALPALITNTAISATRSLRRMAVVAGIQVSVCALVWGLSVALIGPLGITGVGWAWLIGQGVTAAGLLAWPRLWLPGPAPAAAALSTGEGT